MPAGVRSRRTCFSVVLIEAGGDEINDNYAVPAFHPLSTEDPVFSWEFFVKHYSKKNNPERDPKYHRAGEFPGAPGIFYPRAADPRDRPSTGYPSSKR